MGIREGKEEEAAWRRNRLLRRMALICPETRHKVVESIRTGIPWLSPKRLVRYGRVMWAKHGGTTFVGRIPMTGCLMELDPNHRITKAWYIRADYEINIIVALRRFLRPGMVCMDVGANAGLFALFMATSVGDRGRVFAFEPTAATFQWLQKNIELNALRNVVAENVAVTEQTGVVAFHIGPSDLCVYNSISAVVHPSAKSGQFSRVTVPAISIDDYCANHDIRRVDCVKIDVEGAELQVLKGMRRVLEENGQIVLLIEFYRVTAAACGTSVDIMADWLGALGFQLFLIAAKGCLRPLNNVIPGSGEMVWAIRADVT
jgi:FkbM family methyltransferase